MSPMLTRLRARLAELREERDGVQVEARALADREDATDEDVATLADLNARYRTLDDEVRAVEARIDEVVEVEGRQQAAREVAPAPVTVREPDLYGPGSSRSWVFDQIRARRDGDAQAAERLARFASHERERRDVGTGAFGALVVPQYLTEEFAAVLRNGMPWLAASAQETLPDDGMTLNIPRGTTGTSVAAQATENAAVSETDFDETTLAVSVRTFAGQQDVSRQAIERGTNVDRIIFADLAGAYAAAVDTSAINGDGTSGAHTGVLQTSGIGSVTYTDADPTVAEIYPKIANAVQTVQSNRRLGPDAVFMHPRRWGWFLASLDGQSRPLIVPNANGPQNAEGVLSSHGYGTVVGSLLGLAVITDANIPTNLGAGTEDAIIVGRMADSHYFSDQGAAPRTLTFEETAGGNLTVKLVAYGYSAYTAGRYPSAFCKITGTGLIAPTF